MCCRCDDVLCATRPWKVCPAVVLYALEMLEAVEGELSLLEMLEAMRCALLCMLEAVDGGLCLSEVLEVLDAGGDEMCATLYAGGCGG